jgi:hypothetical protein
MLYSNKRKDKTMTIDLNKYARGDGGYWLQPLEHDAAAATGISYYAIVGSETLDMLPEEWRMAIATAAEATKAIDDAKPVRTISTGTWLSEWEIRDGTAE